MVHKRENARKILFDFLKNRKYNYNERVAGERKSSLHAARFYFGPIGQNVLIETAFSP